MGKKKKAKAKNNGRQETFEKTLFKAADKLRKNMDAAEYKHIVLGLIFLKYISDSFEALHSKLVEGKGEYKGADPEDADEYRAENVFFVPPTARWSYLHSRAKLPSIGKDVDDAMTAIEKENPTLKGILPKVFARPNLDKAALGGLIDLVGNIALGDEAAKAKDILGRVYEYFLGEFANAEGKKGGQFYTPKSIVGLMVEMIEPYKGRVFDPCCGSGGMFIMSEKFIESHQGKVDDIAIYGQESNQTTYRLCRMNLAIRQIDGSQVKWNNEGSFLNDAHKDLKADFILANPPFNDSDWSGELLQKDARWKYGVPPASNANYAWLSHMIYHLSPKGIMACVLANGSLPSQTNNEGDIRKNLIENDLIDCIINLPKQLFYNTQIQACLWFISRKKTGNGDRKRSGEILFIDAGDIGYMRDRTHRDFSEDDIAKIAGTYHNWRGKDKKYEDIKGFCKSATLEEIKKRNFILAPGRYIGMKESDDDGVPFLIDINIMNQYLREQTETSKRLNREIANNLNLFYEGYDWKDIDFSSSAIMERIAQKLYHEWFVEFNFPNNNNKPYKNTGGKMIDSELGEIPEGWRAGKLREEFEIIMGQSPNGKSYNESGEGMIFFQGRAEFQERFPTIRLYTTEPKRVAEKFDVLVSVRAPVGDINVAFDKCCIGRGLAAVRGKYKSYTLYKIKSLKDAFNKFEAEGTVFGCIGKNDFSDIDVIIPEPKIAKLFEDMTSKIDERIYFNYSQIQTLSKLRVALLPKLMKGEIRVKL